MKNNNININQPLPNFRKTKPNWERPSLNSVRSDQPGLPPWANDPKEEVEEFYNQLNKIDYKVDTPWGTSLNEKLEQRNAEVIPPYLCSFNHLPDNTRPAKKKIDKGLQKSVAPWKHGEEPGEQIARKIYPKPTTKLWQSEEEIEEEVKNLTNQLNTKYYQMAHPQNHYGTNPSQNSYSNNPYNSARDSGRNSIGSGHNQYQLQSNPPTYEAGEYNDEQYYADQYRLNELQRNLSSGNIQKNRAPLREFL